MDLVLTNSDLLDHIFAYTSLSTDATCTQVCKAWFDRAIKYRWHTVDDWWKCIETLAPMEYDEATKAYKFTRIITTRDWARFYRYASNTRCLTLRKEDAKYSSDTMRCIIQEIARCRTQLLLFPNITKLSVHLSPLFAENSALYLHCKLTDVNIYVHNSDYANHFCNFIQTITDRTGAISKFYLASHLKTQYTEKHIIEFLLSQSNLNNVILPIGSITSSVLSTLSSIHSLRHINLYNCACKTCRTALFNTNGFSNTFTFLQKASFGIFSNLKLMDLTFRLGDIKSFFDSALAPKNLTSLYLRGIDLGSLDMFQKTIEVIAKTCRSLTFFYLSINSAKPDEISYSPRLADFKPLYDNHSIYYFFIHFPSPLIICKEDLLSLASSWPRLEYLHLNAEPSRQEEPCADLSLLKHLAAHCPNLHTLSLYLDARCTTTVVLPTSSQLPMLSRLYFGLSPISDTSSVALYLSQICPRNCSVTTELHNSFLLEDMDKAAVERCLENAKKWQDVAALLPVLMKVKQMESSKVSELKKELDKSRGRLKVLEDDISSLRSKLSMSSINKAESNV